MARKLKIIMMFLWLVLLLIPNQPILAEGESNITSSVVEEEGKVIEQEGIVPCGSGGSETACTLCHLIIGFMRLFKYGLYLITTIAFIGIFAGGVMYLVSSGDTQLIESAKGILKGSLVGFSLVLGAWLIVNVILSIVPVQEGLKISKTDWFTFTCNTISTDEEENQISVDYNNLFGSCGVDNMGRCKVPPTNRACPSGWFELQNATCSTPEENCCIKEGAFTTRECQGEIIDRDGNGQEIRNSFHGYCYFDINSTNKCPGDDDERWLRNDNLSNLGPCPSVAGYQTFCCKL